MTTAVLGFKIDSTPASAAAVDLSKLDAAATKLEASADALTASAGALANALKRVGDETKKVPPAAKPFQNQDEHVKAFRAEIERLTMRYQPLAQATRNYEATVSDINRAHQLGIINAQQMTKRLDEERLAFDRLKTSALGADNAVRAANQNTPGARPGGFNTSNLAAQGFDIGSTAAFMPWYTVALQQGPQVAQVFNDIKASGQSIGPAVAGAFLQILNPISLVTIGVIGGAAALVQYFTTAESGSEKTTRLFEEQNEVIRRAADLWGEATPALKGYVDELDRADKIAQGREAGGILAGRELEGLSSNLDSLKVKATEALRSLRGDPNNAIIVRDLVTAWGDLRERLDNGTASMADLNRVQRELAGAVSTYGTPQVLAFGKAFDEVTAAIYRGVEAAQKARTEWIAAIAGGTSVQDIVENSTFNDNGVIRRPSDFIPRVPGIPSRRPSDLAGDPDVVDSRIQNSDGVLVTPGIPGRKPNFFELEKENEKIDEVTRAYRRAQEAKADFWLDLSFSERQSGRSAMDRQIANTLNRYGFNEDLNSPEANALREQLREGEAKDIFKGFFSGAYSEAWSNGGKIGKAIATAALNAAQEASQKAFETLFDTAAGWLASLFTGKSGASAAGPDIVSKAIGAAANDNAALAAPVTSVARSALPATTEIGAYIREAAIKRGIDPDIALRVARSEGGIDSWNLQSNYVKNGVREPSFGPFQLYKGGGLGNAMMKQTGLDPALAANGPAGVDFALDNAKKSGWGQWYGAAKAGIGDWEGIDKSAKAVKDLGAAATDTAKMTAGLGQTLASIPQALMANGGGSGALASLTKYGMGLFGGSSQFASAWLKGGVGLYANGSDYARGGLSIVGDKGPELLNLPQGSGVMSNHKLMSMMAANSNRSGDGIAGIRLFVDEDGNWQAKVESIARSTAKTEDRQSMGAYKQNQQRMGYGEDQRRFNSRKG
ncbi:phage tail tape measure protein [Shinella kummerowiae]|uniref:Phage tail tape measure protein n=1 Tax=Shinella kummerowiae TaxID=417745 RepID=A0A6N8SH17_9HYPH|nr:phage tail length tape measure family protein [Shinella kummerowiae]MXN46050.1 phage tail tape measure protein [Shinella kummerowiae]